MSKGQNNLPHKAINSSTVGEIGGKKKNSHSYGAPSFLTGKISYNEKNCVS